MTSTRSALLIIFLLASAGSMQAQRLSQETVDANDHAVHAALTGLGLSVNMDVYGSLVQRAFNEIYPDERYDQRTLSPTQARAVAYVTLLLNVDPGIDMYPDPHPVLPEDSFLAQVRRSIGDMTAGVPAQGSKFLDEDEQVFLHRAATELGELAASHDCPPLERAAGELIDLAAEAAPDRSDAASRIDELRRVAVEC